MNKSWSRLGQVGGASPSDYRMHTMNAYKTGIAAVAVGVAAYLIPLSPAWTLAAGILALGLGTAALIQALKTRKVTA